MQQALHSAGIDFISKKTVAVLELASDHQTEPFGGLRRAVSVQQGGHVIGHLRR